MTREDGGPPPEPLADTYDGPERTGSGPFASLQNRNFQLFTVGMLVSFTALQMQSLAQNYLVYQLTGLSSAIGYVSAAYGIVGLPLSYFGGVIADRINKRKLLVVTQLSMALLALVLGLLITTELIQVWHIVVSALILGAVSSFNLPARQSYIPDIVGIRNLTSALAVNSGITNLTRIAGPALAGILIGSIGVAPVYYIKAGAYLIFIMLLLMIPIAGKPQVSGRDLAGDAMDCLRYLRRDARLRDLLILGVVPAVLGTPYVNFLPVFQKDIFRVGPADLGLMMSMVGVGAIAGALLVAFQNKRPHNGRVLLASGIGFGVMLVLFAFVSVNGNFPLSLGVLALTGLCSTAFMALSNVMILTVTPPEMRGRVMGIYVASFGLTSLSAYPMGALCDLLGAPFTTAIFGGLTLVSVAVVFALRLDIVRL